MCSTGIIILEVLLDIRTQASSQTSILHIGKMLLYKVPVVEGTVKKILGFEDAMEVEHVSMAQPYLEVGEVVKARQVIMVALFWLRMMKPILLDALKVAEQKVDFDIGIISMRILNVYKGLNKDMYILALYRLISGMGYFVIPYLSLFLTNELTISVIVAGSIVAGANFLCIPTLYISGRITEKIGPKKTIIISQILAAMSYILVVICPINYIKVCFAVLGLCFASVVVPAMDAWATIKNPDEDRRKAFSLLYLSQNIGFAIGSLIIGVAYKTNPNLVFIGDAITTLLAVGMIYVCTEKTVQR